MTETCQISRRDSFTSYLLSDIESVARQIDTRLNPTQFLSLPPIPQSCLWKEGKPMPNSSRSDFANSSSVQKPTDKSAKHVDNARQEIAVPDADRSLALDWILNPIKGRSLSERVLAQLLLAEAKSGDHDHKLAYRLAWHIVLHCMKGDAVECSPVTLAYYSVVGCHEEQYYDRVMIRRAAMFGDANRIPFPARKKKSVSIQPKKEESA